VFVAFSGEEARLAGSRHFVSAPRFPLDGVIGMINLDTVGRLFDGRVSVIAPARRPSGRTSSAARAS
jgi:Zn-dependent M28 family amino/carboxypeptidase